MTKLLMIFEWAVLLRGAVVSWTLIDGIVATMQQGRGPEVFGTVSLVVELAIAATAATLIVWGFFG